MYKCVRYKALLNGLYLSDVVDDDYEWETVHKKATGPTSYIAFFVRLVILYRLKNSA